jgi:hypothetical protein
MKIPLIEADLYVKPTYMWKSLKLKPTYMWKSLQLKPTYMWKDEWTDMKLIIPFRNFAKTLNKEHLTLRSWYVYDNPLSWSMFVIETKHVLCDVVADGEE